MFATSIHIWLPIEIFFLEMEEKKMMGFQWCNAEEEVSILNT
jgi:hypothetical protein